MDLGNGASPQLRATKITTARKHAAPHRHAMRRAFKGIMPRGEAQRLFYGALAARLRGRA